MNKVYKVSEGDACPTCGERKVTKLIKMKDGTIECLSCAYTQGFTTVYIPREKLTTRILTNLKTSAAYAIKGTTFLEMAEKFIRWDLKGDDEALKETLESIKTERDAEIYFDALFRVDIIDELTEITDELIEEDKSAS